MISYELQIAELVIRQKELRRKLQLVNAELVRLHAEMQAAQKAILAETVKTRKLSKQEAGILRKKEIMERYGFQSSL